MALYNKHFLDHKYFLRGEEHRLRGEWEQAIAHYEQVLHIDPAHEDALYWLGCCYLSWGQAENDCFNDYTARFENASVAFKRLLSVLRRKGKLAGSGFEVYHNLGEAQYHLAVTIMQGKTSRGYAGIPGCRGFFDNSIEYYKKAVELNPNSAESYHWLGNAQFTVGLYEEAGESFKRAIELDPDNLTYYYPLANLQEELGLADEAERSQNQAVRLLVENIN